MLIRGCDDDDFQTFSRRLQMLASRVNPEPPSSGAGRRGRQNGQTPKRTWQNDPKRRLQVLLVMKAYKEVKEGQKDKKGTLNQGAHSILALA